MFKPELLKYWFLEVSFKEGLIEDRDSAMCPLKEASPSKCILSKIVLQFMVILPLFFFFSFFKSISLIQWMRGIMYLLYVMRWSLMASLGDFGMHEWKALGLAPPGFRTNKMTSLEILWMLEWCHTDLVCKIHSCVYITGLNLGVVLRKFCWCNEAALIYSPWYISD